MTPATPETGVFHPEFSRIVPLSRIKSSPIVHQISASDDERKALAQRFELLALDRLEARVTLYRQAGDIRLEAELEADLLQPSVASLDPVPESIEDRFVLLYRAGIDEEEADRLTIEEYGDEVIEPLFGEEIDIGEAVAQQLSLAMAPFPRLDAEEAIIFDGPGDATDAEDEDAPIPKSPFDILKSLKKN